MKKFIKAISVMMVVALLATALFACGDNATKDPAAKAVKVIDIDLTQEECAFGVDKTQPELLTQVNAFIAKIKGVTAHPQQLSQQLLTPQRTSLLLQQTLHSNPLSTQ